MLSIRGTMAAMMALSSVTTGVVVTGIAWVAMSTAAHTDTLERVDLVAAGIAPLATEVILTPGDVDLELALLRRLAKLRETSGISRVAIVDAEGRRIPSRDDAPAPEVRTTGSLLTVHGDTALAAHPLEAGGTRVGFLALELDYPRMAILTRLLWLVAATALVMLVSVIVAWVVSAPATRRQRQIVAAVEGMGKGQTQLAEDLPRGRGELGRVGEAVRSLATRLDDAAERRASPTQFTAVPVDDVKLPTARAQVDVSLLLDEVVTRVEGDGGGRVVRQWTHDLRFQTDAQLLGQAVEALVDNAIRHTGDAAITVSAHTTEAGGLIVIVQDTGPGLPDRVVANLFRPIPHAQTGFSTGLALAHRYVRSLGGTLDHDARYAHGTRFILRSSAG